MERKAVSGLMLILLLTGLLTLAFSIQEVRTSEPPPTEWSQTYGGTSEDHAFSAVQTGDGGYAIAGYTKSFGAGRADFWLVKTDSAGNMEWNKTYGGTSGDEAWSVVQTSDGGYVLAGITYSFGAGEADFWLVKTDSAGNMEWNKTYGGTGWDYAYSVVQAGDGGYALAGGTTSYGAGGIDFWLVKTDSAGTMLWNKTYGGAYWDEAWSVVQTSDGGYVLAGITRSFGAGGYDFWLVKTDSAGNMEWNKTYGGTSGDEAYSVVQAGDGGYAIAGYTKSFGAGEADFWLVKTDSAGNMEWNKTYGETLSDEAYSVVQAGDGGYALAGSPDFWLVKTDSAGNMEWNKTYGGTGWDEAWSVVQTSDGGYVLAGITDSFGAGDEDFWLVKLGPPLAHELVVSMTASPTTVYSAETSTITVLVTSDGIPITGADVSLTSDKGGTFSTVTDHANGTYTATFTAPDITTQTTCTITAVASKSGYASGQEQTQVIVQPLAADRGNLNIYVKNAEDNPIAGATVTSTAQPDGQAALSGTTDTNGLAVFNNILAGPYTIKASKTGYEDKTWTVTVIAGQTTTETATQSKPAEAPGIPLMWIAIAIILIVVIIVGAVFAIKKTRTP